MGEKIAAMLFNVIFPLTAIALMMLFCYPVCKKPEGFDYFLFWILVGFPFGIRRMWMWLVPKNYGLAGTLGVLALNCIVGGIIGGFMVVVTFIRSVTTFGSIILRRC